MALPPIEAPPIQTPPVQAPLVEMPPAQTPPDPGVSGRRRAGLPLAVLVAPLMALPRRLAPAWRRLALVTVGLWVAAAAVSLVWPASLPAAVAAVAATTLGVVALVAALAAGAQSRTQARIEARILDALGDDPDPVLLTDRQGGPLGANNAARARAGRPLPQPADLLARWSAEPGRAVATLMAEALVRGHARRDFGRPDGAMRLCVHRAGPAGGTRPGRPAGQDVLVWRLTWMQAAPVRSVDVLGLPVLTLGPEGRPISDNAAFRQLRGETRTRGEGQGAPVPLDPVLSASLAPLLQGASPVPLEVPGPGGGQRRLALATTGRDGQRDIVFLPGWLQAGGDPGEPGQHHDFEDIPVALILIADDGRIIDSNRLARVLLGLAPGELRYFWEVVEGLGRPVPDWLADAREGRALNRPEILRANLPGQETFVQIILRRAPTPGAEEALVAVISDATELKSLEARFVQSQKMQAIGQLAGGVAHDFNNLLTAISGHCDLLLLNRDQYDPDYADLVQIHQNANRAAALVRQLLAFSRKQTLKAEILAPESLLEDLAHLLTRLVGERITLRLVHDPDLGAIRADRRQLEQVIMNLVVNARDAMPMGGEIRITTERMRLERERECGRTRLPAGDYAVIRVADEGVGIAPDLLDKIFEPFFTTKRPGEGTGLGLSTAYGIVKQMGGWIFADSTEGSGTVFTLYFARHRGAEHPGDPRSGHLPEHENTHLSGVATLSAPADTAQAAGNTVAGGVAAWGEVTEGTAADGTAAGEARRADRAIAVADRPGQSLARPGSRPGPSRGEAPPPAAPLEGAVVLLVEDEAPVRAFAARALRLQGYQVIEAENGDQALEFLADPALRVDIFVSDVIMPGLDGPGWVARALPGRPDTPVVFVSGYTEDALSAALARIPRAVFLGKPFALQDLSRTIADQLAARR